MMPKKLRHQEAALEKRIARYLAQFNYVHHGEEGEPLTAQQCRRASGVGG